MPIPNLMLIRVDKVVSKTSGSKCVEVRVCCIVSSGVICRAIIVANSRSLKGVLEKRENTSPEIPTLRTRSHAAKGGISSQI